MDEVLHLTDRVTMVQTMRQQKLPGNLEDERRTRGRGNKLESFGFVPKAEILYILYMQAIDSNKDSGSSMECLKVRQEVGKDVLRVREAAVEVRSVRIGASMKGRKGIMKRRT